jgi:hypothetical protein
MAGKGRRPGRGDAAPPAAGAQSGAGEKDQARANGAGEASGAGERPELEPLPYAGVLSVTVGTGLWLVALIVMLPLAGRLNDDGHLWWLATAAVGFGLGLLGIGMTTRRRARLRAAAAAAPRGEPAMPQRPPAL